MKVLFISSGNSQYNISPIILNQGESLKKIGIEVKYFSIVGKGLKGYFKNIPRLQRYIHNNKFDVIHAHYGLCGIVSQLARNKEKLVVSLMGDDILGSVGSDGKYSLLGNLIVTINKIFLKKYDFVIVKSIQMAKEFNNKDKEIIPNGVDLKLFYELEKNQARARLKIDTDKRIIIFVSNPARKEKNFKLAEDSVKYLDDNSILLLPIFNIKQAELKYYYSAADLLLLTSYHEGSPNVIKEAMACNCPIVSTDVGDVKWVIGNTEGCFLTEPSIKDVSDKIKLALEFAKKNGRTNGRERIIELGLDSETVAKRIIKIYNKVLQNNSQR